jgi:CheY-like chemotaxis protein/HPt (histidine-containing phosphotransfer) domain-containing protein
MADAETAWREAANEGADFKVAIIDLKGFGHAGVALARTIKAADRPSKLILLVGMDTTIADERIGELGAVATLIKPARPSELYNHLAHLDAADEGHDLRAFAAMRKQREKRLSFDGRILVAEDNLVNREVVTGILESMGLEVVTAPNGRAAIDLFMQDKFDVVLMDCEMPVIDGLEAARRIRAFELCKGTAEQTKRTPIVALTAHALIEVRERCLRAGMDDFLAKPFSEMQMGEALRRWLTPVVRPALATDPALETNTLPSTVPAIDTSAFAGIRAFQGAKGAARLKQILSRFLVEAPILVKSIRTMHEEGNRDAVWRTAHSLKSSSAALGALQLSSRCATIEVLARENGLDPVTPHLLSLDAELAAATRGLQKFMETADVAA